MSEIKPDFAGRFLALLGDTPVYREAILIAVDAYNAGEAVLQSRLADCERERDDARSLNETLSGDSSAFHSACGALPSYCDPGQTLADNIRALAANWEGLHRQSHADNADASAALATERAARERAEAECERLRSTLEAMCALAGQVKPEPITWTEGGNSGGDENV